MRPTPADATGSSLRAAPADRAVTHSREDAEDRLALALGMAAICVYAMRRADSDLWGYLSYGRLFVQQGGPVEWDPFSYTCASCTWIYFEYLSHLSLWLAYSVGGPLCLIGLKCVLARFPRKRVRLTDARSPLLLPSSDVGLIRFRGHIPREGYDVYDGRHEAHTHPSKFQ